MIRHSLKSAILAFAVLLAWPRPSGAQIPVGVPRFGSFSGGPDIVNLADLNVHYQIPIRQKNGLVPFYYILTYDSSVWQPVGTSGHQTWLPPSNSNWGWRVLTPLVMGSVTFSETQEVCYDLNSNAYNYNLYSNFAYTDPSGTVHQAPSGFGVSDERDVAPMCKPTGKPLTGKSVIYDDYGYTISASISISDFDGSDYYPNVTLYTRSGGTIVPYIASYEPSPQSPSVTDANSNSITVTTSSGTTTYTDSLNTTALTVSGAGTPASPVTYTYAGPSGNVSAYAKYAYYSVRTNFGCSGVGEYSLANVALVDEIDLVDGSKYTIGYEATPGYSGYVTGRLASVTLPTGGTISYAYSGGSNGIICADGSTATLKRYTPDTGSNYWQYAHSESGTAWTTTLTDPQGNAATYNFQQAQGSQNVYETERQVGSLETVLTCYNNSPNPCTNAANTTNINLPISQRTVLTTLGAQTAETNTTFDSAGYGLPIEVDEYDWGPTIARKTITAYDYNTSCGVTNTYVVSMPCSVTIENGSGTAQASTTYSYSANGNLLSQTSDGLTRSYTYNTNGTVATATDANNKSTSYNYGSGGCNSAFPTTITPPAGPARTLVWNCTGAVLTSSSDTNGTTTYGYTNPSDPFWRVTSIKDPTNAVTDITYTSNSVESVLNFASTSTVDILTTLDGLGRVSLTQRRQAQGSTTFDSVETTYDSLGRTYKVSPPYSAAEGGAYGGSTWNTTLYDALKRPTSVTDAGGGSVAFSYSANDMLRTVTPAPTGENPKKAQYQYDGLGRLKSVCEITGATGSGACTQNTAATGFFTSYTYDLLNNLKTVSQSGQGRTYYYDSLSRLTSEANPESGTTSYFYDTDSTCGTYDGDLVKRVDAVGNVICYAHDAVHRLSAVTYPSGQYSSVTPAKHFVYDSATVNGVAMTSAAGHLAEAYTCTGSCTSKLTDLGFSYSARGDVTGLLESTPSSGGYYSVGATYWPNGLLNVLSGTSMPTITYTPDGEGRVYTMTDNLGNTPVSNTSYNVFGLPTGLALGSGDSDAYVYDPNTGRMTKYQFNVNGQSMVGNITWNPNGTLEQLAITDPFISSDQQTCKYVYDDLARAASINCTLNPSGTANWTQAFSFDAFGNIDKTGNNGGISFLPTYTSNPPTNRYASLPSGTPSYDANGNVLADGFHNYTWDADGNWATIDGAVIIYDALDRIVDEGPGLPYVYGPDGSKLGWYANQQALGNERAPMPGGGRAVYGSNPPLALQQYWHANWQGSTPLATGPNRTVYQDGAFAPYGEPFAGYPNGDFTGQVNDWDPDLYDFLYREYQLTQGRWVSPDPAGLAAVNLANPQTWNRYAYVTNNPQALTDPLGLGDCGGDTSFDCNSPDPCAGTAWETDASCQGPGVAASTGVGVAVAVGGQHPVTLPFPASQPGMLAFLTAAPCAGKSYTPGYPRIPVVRTRRGRRTGLPSWGLAGPPPFFQIFLRCPALRRHNKTLGIRGITGAWGMNCFLTRASSQQRERS